MKRAAPKTLSAIRTGWPEIFSAKLDGVIDGIARMGGRVLVGMLDDAPGALRIEVRLSDSRRYEYVVPYYGTAIALLSAKPEAIGELIIKGIRVCAKRLGIEKEFQP